jgi:type II secretory pathway pseudopilin PulG
MNGGFNTAGFTIIETLIVLGVTAALLFSVLLLVGGKTSQEQFISAISGAKTNLQKVINSASDGSYPNEGNFTCSLASGTITIKLDTPQQQGGNYGCTFVGSLVGFNNFTQPSATNQKYTVYTVVGQQCTNYNTDFSACSNPTTWPETVPYILTSSTGTQSVQSLLSGISLVSTTITDVNGSQTTYRNMQLPPVVGFLINPTQQASATTAIDNLSPGALQLSLYVYCTPVIGSTTTCANSCSLPPSGAALLSATCSLLEANQVDLCFASATTNKSGLITLGGSGVQATVSSQIFGGSSCA